jgi:hypothetical protein
MDLVAAPLITLLRFYANRFPPFTERAAPHIR